MGHLVLVVDDEDKIREFVRRYLEREGLAVLSTGSGAEALQLAGDASPDVLVIDLGLPDVPGEEVVREVRRASRVPILVLTAKASEEQRIRGLEIGADDYVTKPFSPRELVLRVQSLLRRSGDNAAGSGSRSFGDGELVVDEERHELTLRGERVDLTPTEWGLLLALTRVPGRVYSRYELINLVRGYEFEGYERTVDSHVKNLRRKLERDTQAPQIIETVVGAGYRLSLQHGT